MNVNDYIDIQNNIPKSPVNSAQPNHEPTEQTKIALDIASRLKPAPAPEEIPNPLKGQFPFMW